MVAAAIPNVISTHIHTLGFGRLWGPVDRLGRGTSILGLGSGLSSSNALLGKAVSILESQTASGGSVGSSGRSVGGCGSSWDLRVATGSSGSGSGFRGRHNLCLWWGL